MAIIGHATTNDVVQFGLHFKVYTSPEECNFDFTLFKCKLPQKILHPELTSPKKMFLAWIWIIELIPHPVIRPVQLYRTKILKTCDQTFSICKPIKQKPTYVFHFLRCLQYFKLSAQDRVENGPRKPTLPLVHYGAIGKQFRVSKSFYCEDKILPHEFPPTPLKPSFFMGYRYPHLH